MHRRKPSRITLYLLLGLLLLTMTGISAVQNALYTERQQTLDLRQELSRQEQNNDALEQRIYALGTEESAEQIARERLHWAYDQEVVYIGG